MSKYHQENNNFLSQTEWVFIISFIFFIILDTSTTSYNFSILIQTWCWVFIIYYVLKSIKQYMNATNRKQLTNVTISKKFISCIHYSLMALIFYIIFLILHF